MAGFKRQLLADDDAHRHTPNLGELAADGLDVFCRCNRCGHSAALATAELIAQFGPDFAVPEIGGRLRCTGCGAKDVATHPTFARSDRTVTDLCAESP